MGGFDFQLYLVHRSSSKMATVTPKGGNIEMHARKPDSFFGDAEAMRLAGKGRESGDGGRSVCIYNTIILVVTNQLLPASALWVKTSVVCFGHKTR